MDIEQLLTELSFSAIRSSGPGGQHVNKTASKVEVSFDLENSKALSDTERNRLLEKLSSRITTKGTITLQCGETRSQHKNKSLVIDRLVSLLQENLKVPKKRKKTKPSKSAVEKRLKSKRVKALKKSNRKPPPLY